jgi:hypothetical protein
MFSLIKCQLYFIKGKIYIIFHKIIKKYKVRNGDGDWGLGIGDWGLGGDWAQSPIPNPQSPIPNPQSPINKY